MPLNTPRLDALNARNLFLNGNFDFWQRGTSQSINNADVYLADRWVNQISTAFTVTVSRSTDVPTVAQSGYQSQYSLLYTNGTGALASASRYIQLRQRVEGLNYQLIHGQKARVQIWVKSSVAGTYAAIFQNSGASRSYVTPITIVAPNTWEIKTVDLTMDTSGTWLLDNGIGLSFGIVLSAGSVFQTGSTNQWLAGDFEGLTGQTQWGETTGATFQVAQAMLIPFDSTYSPNAVIPFSRNGRNIAEEFIACQRYYQKPTFPNNSGQAIQRANYVDATTLRFVFQTQVSMRAAPVGTVLASLPSQIDVYSMANSAQSFTSATFNDMLPDSYQINMGKAAHGLSDGHLRLINNSQPWALSAEL